MPIATRHILRSTLLAVASIGFIAAGANHFRHAELYERMIPPGFTAPSLLVIVSGVFEIIGGIGLLIPRLRRAAGWGLILLLITVFPANVYMAIVPEKFPDFHVPRWAFWARLPMQAMLIAWIYFVALRRDQPALSQDAK